VDDDVNDVLHVHDGQEAVTLFFDRPDKRNALNRQLSEAISSALRTAESSAKPLVLRSRAAGMFVGGADVAELKERGVEDSLGRMNARLFQQLFDHPWPTIALVDGAALGGGCELALACDFRITSERAQWGLPEVRLGIIPSAGGLTRLSRLIGVGNANDLVLTGRRVLGDEALRLGLVNRCLPAEQLDAGLADLLRELRRAAPLAVRLAKEAMRVDGDRHRLVDAAAQALCIGSDEAQQRLQALLDRTAGRS
jgi:enoyl-CoA hydratase